MVLYLFVYLAGDSVPGRININSAYVCEHNEPPGVNNGPIVMISSLPLVKERGVKTDQFLEQCRVRG
ncbi:MAG: hypothetical protein AB1486_31990 [Planctomycetota bacterium]